jgi:hypothetical protein
MNQGCNLKWKLGDKDIRVFAIQNLRLYVVSDLVDAGTIVNFSG